MSVALYDIGGLRFWTEKEIQQREHATATILSAMVAALTKINTAWTFHRVDGPLLTPRPFISEAYSADDIFELNAKLGVDSGALRAETTASSYLYAKHLIDNGLWPPLCVWQAGKSFRQERQDGSSPSNLRYKEFYQLEFQCVYGDNTKADYRSVVEPAIEAAVREITCCSDTRIVASDRLPTYSTETNDVETIWKNDYKEVASISTRTDFSKPKFKVLEVAIGLDRLVAILGANLAMMAQADCRALGLETEDEKSKAPLQ